MRLKVVKSLLDAGVKLQTARKAIEYLRDDLGDDWATASLVLDGTQLGARPRRRRRSSTSCASGQGVLNIVPLGPVVDELDASIHELGDAAPATPGASCRTRRAARRPPRAADACDRARRRSRTSRSASRTTPSGSSPSSSTSTASRGSTSRARSRSSATATAIPRRRSRPDFYLPAYDLYIEITTLNQKLVTKKNRKARRLRELYPEVQIKVLYQRDYLHLLVKYGLEPPSQLARAGDGAARARRRRSAGADRRRRAPAEAESAARVRA